MANELLNLSIVHLQRRSVGARIYRSVESVEWFPKIKRKEKPLLVGVDPSVPTPANTECGFPIDLGVLRSVQWRIHVQLCFRGKNAKEL